MIDHILETFKVPPLGDEICMDVFEFIEEHMDEIRVVMIRWMVAFEIEQEIIVPGGYARAEQHGIYLDSEYSYIGDVVGMLHYYRDSLGWSAFEVGHPVLGMPLVVNMALSDSILRLAVVQDSGEFSLMPDNVLLLESHLWTVME